MPRTGRRLRALAASSATVALSVTLLGAQAPGADAKAKPASGAGLLPAPAGLPAQPVWPEGDFSGTGAVAPAAASDRGGASAPAGPADGAVLAGARTELTAQPQSGAVAYEFVLGTGDGPRAGQVTSSGWRPEPRWTVPAGVLKDGGSYRWTLRTRDRSGAVGQDAPARTFTVNQRLGALAPGGPAPSDTLGPVTVNLANGNATVSVDTGRTQTGAGPLGATFTYDSLAVQAASGLTGAYYAGDSGGGIGAAEKPQTVRTDSAVGFRWGAESPQGAFRARWTGSLTVPATGRYRLGGSYAGGLRVLIDGRPVHDDWNRKTGTGARPVYGKEVTLRGGRAHTITVEYRRPADADHLALWIAGTDRAAPVPSSWLTPSGAVLPPGWTVSPAATGPETTAGAAAPAEAAPAGQDGPTGLTAPGGHLLAGAAGERAAGREGRAAAPRSKAHRNEAPGNKTPRNRAAEDTAARIKAAEEDGLRFLYAGSPECGDDSGAPAGYVCAVRVPGAGTSRLLYRGGTLTRVVNPGGETTDFGFTADHRLVAVRTPLLTDWVGVAPSLRDTPAAQFRIEYRPGTAQAARITAPEPTGNVLRPDRRPQRSYAYTPGVTEVRVAGLASPHGWARKVGFDAAGRLTDDTDATGRTVRQTWTAADQPASVTDAAGRMTTTVHNEAGLPVGAYGPGPASCFGPDLKPLAPAPQGCEKVPSTTTAYGPEGVTAERADTDGVPHLVTRNLLSEQGLPFGTETDPGGLALKTLYSFDEAFRPVAKTGPDGARQEYAYYGTDESADNPCTEEDDPAPQRGLPKSVTLPAPASGPGRVEKFVFSARGLPVAVNFGGDKWTCVSYDARGRMTGMKIEGNAHLPARDVVYDHAHHGDPLTTVARTPGQTLVIVTDLLGRRVQYTDTQGTHTVLDLDRAGRAVAERTVAPNPADRPQTLQTGYDAAGRKISVTLNGTRLADASYDAAGALEKVRYANGTRLELARDAAGRLTTKNWTLADGRSLPSEVTRSRSGTIVDERTAGQDARPDGPNYRYDAAGRLVQAWIGGHEYGRDFTARAAAGCPAGTRAEAGAASNVSVATDRSARGTRTTSYCYDASGRLLAALGDGELTGFTYTLNGHLSGYTAGGRTVTQRQDTVERHLGGAVTGEGAADVRYGQDIADHLTSRTARSAAGSSTVYYSHTSTDNGDVDLALNGTDRRLLTRVVRLPGGLVLSAAGGDPAAARTTWSHTTVRGDVFALTGADGRQRGGLYQYGLYGEPLRADGTPDPQHVPDNMPGSHDYGRLGQFQVATEHEGSFFNVVLGTRVLNPDTGRFSAPVSAPDPFHSAYEYAAGDPVNHTSTDGYTFDVERD
ncbi:hypothetical protein AMK26_16140 [Streptomyces sp. CB03234]|uniref:PA14 domain-containing protein n=1 Tax=Streptomyces sp. (strain CB03234) TaxID=1703937 RepID=UPI00093B523B|nr:PA14 domain-containing protein [Streptomyces sp. CB03234]OKK04808.1 hypothetical protein AMK26_16140 [Streptomyces sp. CB03234]